ncbi:hypothetical protein BH20ACT8_BH20ACT8_09000 [soil metagenome]
MLPPTHAPIDLLEGLNDPQRAAVLHDGGPLLVVAGAGSGKTRVLTHRIAHLVHERGVHPMELLAITFTNKAADEMKERVGSLVGERLVGMTRDADGTVRHRRWTGMWVATFHSACARLLRAEAHRLGYDRSFSIYDQADATRLVGMCLADLGIDTKKVPPRGAAAAISAAKNELVDFDTYALRAGSWWEQQVAEAYKAYAARLHRASAFDFDDLLVKTVELLQLFDDVTYRYREQFRHVLVDEWQDTNRAQYELVKTLAFQHRNLTVVGDSDQCLPAGTLVSTEGAAKPIEQIRAGEVVLSTGGRGVTCPGVVTRAVPGVYRGALWKVRAGGKLVRGTPHHLVPARVEPLPGKWFVYLLHRDDHGYRVGIAAGAVLAAAADRAHAERLWLVRTCDSGGEAACWASSYAAAYDFLDSATAAKQLFTDLELHPEFPHHLAADAARRQTVTLSMFDARGPADVGHHRIQWFPDHADVSGCVRVERSYVGALRTARTIAHDGGLQVRRRMIVAGRHYELMPLAHVHPGMRVLVERDGTFDDVRVDSVEREEHDGPVYDLEVDRTHNYVADGLVVHNSIYRFRGADIRNILDFERDFPDATRITLDRNYRSTQTILDASNAVIANNTQRLDKDLWTDVGAGVQIVRYLADNEDDEAAFVAEEVDRLADRHGTRAGDCAVFYRTNAQSRVIEEVLIRLGMPYQIIGGTRFYERREIKDVLAYLRLLINPADDVSAKRVINVPRRSIGAKSEEALDLFAARERVTFLEACRRVEENHLLSARAQAAVAAFVRLLDVLRTEVAEGGVGLRELVELTVARTGYLDELQAERTVEALGRVENVRELGGVADDFAALDPVSDQSGLDGLAAFLERVALIADADQLEDTADRLTLMTMHNAKGLEFDVVFMVGLEDAVFPHYRSLGNPDELEEERRLCYVAMTRAKRRLYLSSAWKRTLFGGTNANPPSRFLKEVPGELMESRAGDQGGAGRRAGARLGPRTGSRDGDTDEELTAGDAILHPTFGHGRILEISGSPGSEEVQVRFDEYGTKRLLLAYAPLVRA